MAKRSLDQPTSKLETLAAGFFCSKLRIEFSAYPHSMWSRVRARGK